MATEIATIAKAVVDNSEYLYYDTNSIPATAITTKVKFDNKSINFCLNSLADRADAVWYIDPDGKVHFYLASNLTDSAITLTQATNNISPPIVSRYDVQINYVKVWGGIGTDGNRVYGEAEDTSLQKIHGKIEFVGITSYPEMTDETELDNLADKILNSDLASDYPMEINFSYKSSGYIQVGETINLTFTYLDELATATDYCNIENIYNIKGNNTIFTLSNGLLQGGGFGTPLNKKIEIMERRIDDNTQLIEQNASDIFTIDTWKTTQHTRVLTPLNVIPENGVTAGANNCYWLDGSIVYGTTGLNGYCKVQFDLPDDYVEGTDLIMSLWWRAAAASEVIEYSIVCYRGHDSLAYSLEDTETSTWTGAAVAWCINEEIIIFDGTNFDPGDMVSFLIKMEDDNNAAVSYLEGVALDIQVNERV